MHQCRACRVRAIEHQRLGLFIQAPRIRGFLVPVVLRVQKLMVNCRGVRQLRQILGVAREVGNLLLEHLLEIDQSGGFGTDEFGQNGRAINDHVLVPSGMPEAHKDWNRSVHGEDDGCLMIGRIDSVDRVTQTQI